ncbi:hypothetical protein PALB_9090 [Pseudoalteromonas luteoviolacea B = ATCC 29581]|nr:hypothetical protein PALB_9090 [Pseudoalteromonas luteoviolacea B = ATCC 29581]
MLVAFSALMIGLFTAIISVYSAYIDRQYARASVWPKLELYRSYSDSTFSYGIANKGIGPAIINYATVQVDGQFIKHWVDIPEFELITQSHFGTTTMIPGQELLPLKYKGADVVAILALDKRIKIEICYCSIYDECWVTDRTMKTTSVSECSILPEHGFQQ